MSKLVINIKHNVQCTKNKQTNITKKFTDKTKY